MYLVTLWYHGSDAAEDEDDDDDFSSFSLNYSIINISDCNKANQEV